MAHTYAQVDDLAGSTPGESAAPRGFTPLDLIIALRRRWWAVVAVAGVVLGVGMWRTLNETRLYKAKATVRVQQYRPPIQGMGPAQGIDYRVDNLLSEQQVIRSRLIGQRVARRLGLQLTIQAPTSLKRSQVLAGTPVVDSTARIGEYALDLGARDYTLTGPGGKIGTAAYGTPLSGGGITLTVPQRPAVENNRIVLGVQSLAAAGGQVSGGLETRTVPNTNIVEILFTGPDQPLVRDVTNVVAEEYAKNSAEVAQAAARNKTLFVEKSLNETYPTLRAMQDSLRYFKEGQQLADANAEALALSNTIHGFETERERLLVQQKIYEQIIGKLAQADTVDEGLRRLAGTGAIAGNDYLQKLFDQWFNLNTKRDSLMASGRNEGNPDVQTVERAIVRTKRDIQSASGNYLQRIASEQASLDRTIADLRTKAERYPKLQAEQARLEAQVKTIQHSYDELLSQLNMARIAESADAGNVTLLDPATTPDVPISPNRKRAFMYSLLIGLLLGAGLAILLERLDDSVKSPDDLRIKFDLTILGLIPAIRPGELDPDGDVPTSNLGRLVTHADPRSPVAEAYRALRTNLAFARAHEAAQAIAVVSPAPADGKSTTVANLAITFSQQGQRTLLIDADLRRAVLDKTFDVPRMPGLTDVLIGAVPLVDAVNETKVPNLFVMGSGQFPPNPSELLGSAAMRRAVEEAKKHFDIVLFDTPPLLAVTDGAVLSTMVDGTVLVVRTGATAREAVRRAVGQLRTVTSRVLGVVLNDVTSRGGSYYGGYGYYYYAYYGHDARGGNGKRNGNGMMGRLRKLTGSAPARRG